MDAIGIFGPHRPNVNPEAILEAEYQVLRSPHLEHGVVDLSSNFDHFDNDEEFVVIYDEIHIPQLPTPRFILYRWKVLVVAAFNLKGGNFHFLYLKTVSVDTDVLGSQVIYEGVQTVLSKIEERGFSTRLLAVISNRCPANLLAYMQASHACPVLWDVTHLRKNLVEHYVVDTVLDQTYNYTFQPHAWENHVFPPINEDYAGPGEPQGRIQRELTEIQRMLQRHFNRTPEVPLHPIHLKSNNLEICGSSFGELVYNVMLASTYPSRPNVLLMAALVGIAERITKKPNSEYH